MACYIKQLHCRDYFKLFLAVFSRIKKIVRFKWLIIQNLQLYTEPLPFCQYVEPPRNYQVLDEVHC
jgi:hypothetical protein